MLSLRGGDGQPAPEPFRQELKEDVCKSVLQFETPLRFYGVQTEKSSLTVSSDYRTTGNLDRLQMVYGVYG